MRIGHLLALAGLFQLSGPAVTLAQSGDLGCTFSNGEPIELQPWDAIQDYLRHLDSIAAFDRNPLVSDRQSLVRRGLFGSKGARSMALVAGRRAIAGTHEDALAQGCFVGLIESEKAEGDIGAFKGKTFVWVDAGGPGGTWRSLHFPLDGASTLDEATVIEMPYMLPDPTGRGIGPIAPAGAHHVYKGTLYRGELDTQETFVGARWMIQPPASLTPVTGDGGAVGYYETLASASKLEVMSCFRCDRTTCCPQTLLLWAFEILR